MKGSDFVRNVIWSNVGDAREEAIFQAFASGQMPGFLTKFVEIVIKPTTPIKHPLGDVLEIHCEVTSDFLAVGESTDFVRMPMRPGTAQRVADRLKCLLPTQKLVDAIEAQPKCRKVANVGLDPSKVPASIKSKHKEDFPAFMEFMHTSEAYQVHNQQIETGALKGVSGGTLVSGHKKHIVIPPMKGKVVIYDWPDKNGRRSTHGTHGSFYVDYSHGVRLVRNSVTLIFSSWGDVITYEEALKHPTVHKAFVDTPLINPRYSVDG